MKLKYISNYKFIVFLLLFLGTKGWGQTAESFNNIPTVTPGNYLARTWIGDNGGTWNATSARTDQTLNGKAICTNNSGTITSNSVAGGMDTLTFNYVRGFTGTGVRTFTVWVNGNQIGGTTTVNSSSNTVQNYSAAVNVSGNVQLEIRTAGAQIIIDDINWTSYTPSSNTISTETISGSQFCAGATVSVPFTSNGTFNPGNVYTAQLSSSTGNFSAPVSIGTITSTANSGTISATIPANTTSGTGYRIRVVSDKPLVNGVDNGTNITVNAATAIINSPANQNVNVGVPATFSVTAQGTVLTYQWQLSTNGGTTWNDISGATAATYTTGNSMLSMNGYQYRVIVNGTCGTAVTSGVATLTINQGPCIDEGFDGTTNSTPPSGWVFSGLGTHYTTGGSSGKPSLKFDSQGDQVITPSVFPNTAQELSFWIKGNVAAGTATSGTFRVEGFNGTSWIVIDDIINQSTTATVKTYNSSSSVLLPAGIQQFRFTYSLATNGNIALDDVKVICNTNTTPPTIVLGNNSPQVSAGNINRNSVNNILSKFKLDISGNSAQLLGADLYFSGTYSSADIATNGLKLWYSNTNDFSAASVIGSASSTAVASNDGDIIAISGLSQYLNAGTCYFWITADVSATAVLGRNIQALTVANTDLHFYSGNKSGSATIGGLQTIINAIPDKPTAFTKVCTTATTQQLSWNAPESGADGYLLVVREGTLPPHAVTAIVAQTTAHNLDYSAAPIFGTTTPESHIVYSGTLTDVTVTGLTAGKTYYFALYAYNSNGSTSTVYSAATTTTQNMGVSEVSFATGTGGNAQASVSWQNPVSTCFSEIMAVVTTTPGITFVPNGDGSAYTANAAYTTPNQVVYKGNGNLVTITGLTNNTTYYVEIFVRNGTSWSKGVEVAVTPSMSTVFKPGELFFVGYDGQYLGSGPDDQYLIATLVDIQKGTTFSLVNSRYEAGAAADVRTNKWGGSGDFAGENPGVAVITYNGNTPIPAGSVIVLNTNGADSVFRYYGVITNDVESNRTSDFSAFLPYGTGTAPNISTTAPDQIFLIQGTFTDDGNIQTGEANYILDGTLLHGLSNRTAWVPLTSANSGGTANANRTSRLPAELECFNLYYPSSSTIVGYYKNNATHTGTFRELLTAVNNSTNWDYLSGNNGYSLAPDVHDSFSAGRTFVLNPSGIEPGSWISNTNTTDGKDWYYCQNWENLRVPDKKTDVVIKTGTVPSIISGNSSRAARFSSIAALKNLTIETNSSLSMPDSNSKMNLFGNWTNNAGLTAFNEGLGTVEFMGTVPQIINGNNHASPEEFYNIVLKNSFDTSVSNNLIANGELTIETGYNILVAPNDYIIAANKLTHKGAVNQFIVESDGNLLQVNDNATNTGNITVKRDINVSTERKQYNYLISPVVDGNLKTNVYNGNVSSPSVQYYIESNNFFGQSSGTYIPGRALAVKEPATGSGPFTVILKGAPANGIITYNAVNSAPSSNTPGPTLRGYNLIGNPYPSNMDLRTFYTNNGSEAGNLSSTFLFWDNIGNAETTQQGSTYNGNAYATYNAVNDTGTAATADATASGKKPGRYVKVGQGFVARVINTSAKTLTFNNSTRTKNSSANSFFGKNGNTMDRYWLNMITPDNLAVQIAVVYFEGGSNSYGADDSYAMNSSDMLYSISEGLNLGIQGRSPFVQTDAVPLGSKHNKAGTYTIALDQKEGVFANGQNIYLKDHQTGTVTNLSEGDYSFTANAGELTGRFEIIYQPEIVLTTDAAVKENLMVYKDGTDFVVKSPGKKLNMIEVFDGAGRMIFNIRPNSNKAVIDGTQLNSAMYVLKIYQDGAVTSRKIVK